MPSLPPLTDFVHVCSDSLLLLHVLPMEQTLLAFYVIAIEAKQSRQQ